MDDRSQRQEPPDTARCGASGVAPASPPGHWEHDQVVTNSGVVIPVRATALRPDWADLPRAPRDVVETLEGAGVVSSWSAGTGFTPGFASSLDLADGRRVFVKAASSLDDEVNGWPLSDAYRDEIFETANSQPYRPV